MQLLKNGPVWIDDAEVASTLTHDMAYDAVHDALACHSVGSFDQPLKPYVRPGGREHEAEQGRLISMPGFVGDPVNALGAKLIAGFPSNLDRGLPRASGIVVLNCPETGIPLAIMDCQTLSARRTAAVASVAVDHLATHSQRRIGIIGAGPICGEVISSLLSRHRDIESVAIFDVRSDRSKAMVTLGKRFADVPFASSPTAEHCVRNSNVIVTAVTGTKNYLPLSWLSGDWLLIPLSLDDCTDDVPLAADKIICDDFAQGNREEKMLHRLTKSGKLSRANIYAELGEIVAGKKAGREGDERIYANLMGMAIEDIAVADRVYRKVLSHNTHCSY